jgi:hypothetical protein
MGFPRFGIAVAVAATAAAGTSAAVNRAPATNTVSCADSVYQTPASTPPHTYEALKLGPVTFNHLAIHARKDMSPPTSTVPFFTLASFFDVLTSARRGVTIRLLHGDPADRLAAGRIGPRQAARAIRFPLCRDPETHTLQITQYGISFLLRKQGCFTVEVQPMGSLHRYRARIPAGLSRCNP